MFEQTIEERISENRFIRRGFDKEIRNLDDELIDLLNQKFMLDNGYGVGNTVEYYYKNRTKTGTGEIKGIRYDDQRPVVLIIENEDASVISIGVDNVIKHIK